MGSEMERLLYKVSGQLEQVVSTVEAIRKENGDLRDRVAAIEAENKALAGIDVRDRKELEDRLSEGSRLMRSLVGEYGKVEKRLSAVEGREGGGSAPVSAWKKYGFQVVVTVTAAFICWFFSHLALVAEIAKKVQEAGGKP